MKNNILFQKYNIFKYFLWNPEDDSMLWRGVGKLQRGLMTLTQPTGYVYVHPRHSATCTQAAIYS